MDENIYNFNKTGFTMSIIATAKVIIQVNKCTHLSFVQSGNHK